MGNLFGGGGAVQPQIVYMPAPQPLPIPTALDEPTEAELRAESLRKAKSRGILGTRVSQTGDEEQLAQPSLLGG